MTERARHIVTLLVMGLVILLLSLFVTTPVAAQQTTERFIPIGQSPGVSGQYSYLGSIVEVDEASGTITVKDSGGRHTIKLDDKTDIWVDRSKSKNRNRVGERSDCKVGRRVEVMHRRNDPDTAQWVKIEE